MAIEGLDKIQREMQRFHDNIQRLSGTRTVPITDLLTDDFMREHTSFLSAQQMFDASGFEINSAEDFQRIPDQEWDAFILHGTQFTSWDDMLGRAGEVYVVKQLEL
jgi:hypothetical protein